MIEFSSLKEGELYQVKLADGGENYYFRVEKLYKNGRIKFHSVNHECKKVYCAEVLKMGPVMFNKVFRSIKPVQII